ncbi:hypothetical protein T492DRAFT_880152, partial [Pavlovales sp. CCMP2436]
MQALLLLASAPLASLVSPRAAARLRYPTVLASRASVRLGPSDEDLFASLRARVGQGSEDKGLQPLGPEEVGADCMGPQDVIDYV